MVIAGGDWQIELIKKAKSMGHYVICSNLYKDSKGFKSVMYFGKRDVSGKS